MMRLRAWTLLVAPCVSVGGRLVDSIVGSIRDLNNDLGDEFADQQTQNANYLHDLVRSPLIADCTTFRRYATALGGVVNLETGNITLLCGLVPSADPVTASTTEEQVCPNIHTCAPEHSATHAELRDVDSMQESVPVALIRGSEQAFDVAGLTVNARVRREPNVADLFVFEISLRGIRRNRNEQVDACVSRIHRMLAEWLPDIGHAICREFVVGIWGRLEPASGSVHLGVHGVSVSPVSGQSLTDVVPISFDEESARYPHARRALETLKRTLLNATQLDGQ